MKSFYLKSMGCKSNQYEGTLISQSLTENGFSEIEDTGKLKYIGKDVTLNQYLNKDYFDLITKGAVYEY